MVHMPEIPSIPRCCPITHPLSFFSVQKNPTSNPSFMLLIRGWAFPMPCSASRMPPVLLKYLRALHIHQHLTLHCSLMFIGDFLYVRHCHEHCIYPSVNSFPPPFKVELLYQGHVARLVDCRPTRSESGACYSPASKSTPLPHLELCFQGGSLFLFLLETCDLLGLSVHFLNK